MAWRAPALPESGFLDHSQDLDEIRRCLEALETIVESARDHAGLIAIAEDEDDARRWRDRGAGIVLFALPSLLAKRLRNLSEHVRAQAGP